MIFSTSSIRHAGQKGERFSIKGLKKMTGEEAIAIRNLFSTLNYTAFNQVYLDASEVEQADLSGVNEIIHAHYTLQKINLPFVLVYRRHSVLEKWISTTGLDAYIQTALLPAA
jgi:anti-anti-sigma regulatory factor